MESLFSWLTHAVNGAPALALAASFLWGILSVILSPCHLASIPLIVGFIDRQGPLPLRRALAISISFAIGILLTIAILGALTAGAGRLLGDVGRWGNYAVAAVFFLVGLWLMDVIRLDLNAPGQVPIRRKGILAAFILGLLFGLALGPCTFAFMAPMLAVTFKLAQTALPYGLSLLLAYALGHCAVIALAGTFTGAVQSYLAWTQRRPAASLLRRSCGALVLAAGLYLIYITP